MALYCSGRAAFIFVEEVVLPLVTLVANRVASVATTTWQRSAGSEVMTRTT